MVSVSVPGETEGYEPGPLAEAYAEALADAASFLHCLSHKHNATKELQNYIL